MESNSNTGSGEGSTSSPNSTSTTTPRPTPTHTSNSLPNSQPNSLNSTKSFNLNPTRHPKAKSSKPLPPLPKSTYTTLTLEATRHRGRLVRWFLDDELAKRIGASSFSFDDEPHERKGDVKGKEGEGKGDVRGKEGEGERERERKELEEISKRKEGWACAVEEGLDELGRCFAVGGGSNSDSGASNGEWLRELRRVRRAQNRGTGKGAEGAEREREKKDSEEGKGEKGEKEGEKGEIEQKEEKRSPKPKPKKKRKTLLLLVSFPEPTTSHNHDHVSSPRRGGGKEAKEPKPAIGIRFRENVWDGREVLFGQREEGDSTSHIGGTFHITGLPSSSPSSPSLYSPSGAHALLIQILKLSTYTQLSLILEHHLLSDSSVPLTYPRPKLPTRGVGGSVPSPTRRKTDEDKTTDLQRGKRKEGGFFGGALMNFFSRNAPTFQRSKTISSSGSFSSPFSSSSSSPTSPSRTSSTPSSSPFTFSRPKPQIQTPIGLPTLDIGTSGFRRFSIVGESSSTTSSSSSSSSNSPVSGSGAAPAAGAGSAVEHLRNQATKGGGGGGGRHMNGKTDTPYLKTFYQLQKSRFLLSTSPGIDIAPPTLITQLAQIEASHPSAPPTTSHPHSSAQDGQNAAGRHNYHPVIRLKGDQKTALGSMLGWEWSGGGKMVGVEGFLRQQGLEGVVSWGVCASSPTTRGEGGEGKKSGEGKSGEGKGKGKKEGSTNTTATSATATTVGSSAIASSSEGEGSVSVVGRSATESTTATATTESTTTTSTTSTTSPVPPPTISTVSSTPTSREREKESFTACGQPRWRSWRYFSYTSPPSSSTSVPNTLASSPPSSGSGAGSGSAPAASRDPLDTTLEDTLRRLAEGADDPCQGKGKKGEICGRRKGEHEMRVGHGRVCVVVRVASTPPREDEDQDEVEERQRGSDVAQALSGGEGESGDVGVGVDERAIGEGKEVAKEVKAQGNEKAGEAKEEDEKEEEDGKDKEEEDGEEEEDIETYTSCSICGAKTQRRRVSDGTLLYSTGKFIELLIYSPSLCLLKPTLCEHTKPPLLPWPCLPISRFNLVRHFVVRSSAPASSSGDEQDGKEAKEAKERKEGREGKEKSEKDGKSKEARKPKDANANRERKQKTYTISFSTTPIDDLHDLKVPRLQIIRGHHHAVAPDSGPANSGVEQARDRVGGEKDREGNGKGDGKVDGKGEEDEKRKLRREMRSWWEGVYGHIDELETILADTGEAMERAKAREASTSTSATEESRFAEDVEGADSGGIDRATTPTPAPSSTSTPPTPTPNYIPRKLKALPRLPSEDADFHEAATPVATQRFRFPGKETYPGLGGLEAWISSVPPSTPLTAKPTPTNQGTEAGREFPGDPVTPRKVSGASGKGGKDGDYFGPGNEDTPTVLPFPPPPTPESSERSKASASGTVALEKGTATTTPTRSNSVKTSVLSTSSGRTNATVTTKSSNTTTTSPITQETITALETKLSNLRFTFQRMEQSLYAQLGRTADGNLNDVRRNFEAAARGVEKRVKAWQRKNFGGVEVTRTALGLGVDSGSHVGTSAEPTTAIVPESASKGEGTASAAGAPEGSMIGTAVSAGVAAAAGSVAGGGVGAAGGTLVDTTKGVGRGKVPEYTPKADPGWWGENCHAAPGSSIIVREDDWSSLIAYTLSTSDYLIELANMSFARFGSTSNSVTTPELPTDSSVSTKESSLFSAALGYKLFTVAVNQQSSSNANQAQGDPDAEGVIWNEPEMFKATISRVSHPRDTSGGAGMSIFKDVMRQKSVDVSSLASRNAASGAGGVGSGSGHTGERAGAGGGGGVPGVAGSRTSTAAQPPPMAYAKPDVGITKNEVDGELTVKQRSSKGDAGKETVDRLLLDLEQFSGEKGQKTAGLYNSPSGSTLSTVSKKSKPPSIVSVMSTDSQSTVGKSEEMNRTSPDTQPVPPPVPPKDQHKAEKQSSGTRSPPSTTASTIANTLSSGISNAMRFVRRDNTTSRPMSPILKAHHGLLLAEPATGVEDRPHIKYEWTIGKRLKFTCTVYYAKQFDSLRKRCGIDDSFVQSLARSSSWLAEGGKSKSRFRKTEDEKFIIKTLLDTWNVADLQVLLELAPSYFQYMDSTASKATSLAKMMGFYSVEIKNVETGVVQSQADLLVMENLFYGYKITKVFDLKGISGRKVKPQNRDSPGNAAPRTLFDGEWIEGQQKALVLVKPHSRQVLRCALRNDAEFLARSNIMDYSLLVGVEEGTKEIICGIVDTIGSYTIAKTLEYKAKQNLQSGKETTVMPPAEYQERFINALEGYFVACPDKWSKPEDSSKLIQNINELPSVL